LTFSKLIYLHLESYKHAKKIKMFDLLLWSRPIMELLLWTKIAGADQDSI